MNSSHYDHEKLYHLRKFKGLSRKQLADQLGKSEMTIGRVEKGTHASFELLTRITQILGAPITDFLRQPSPPANVKKISSRA